MFYGQGPRQLVYENDKTILFIDSDKPQRWNPASKAPEKSTSRQTSNLIPHCSFSPRGRYVVTASDDRGFSSAFDSKPRDAKIEVTLRDTKGNQIASYSFVEKATRRVSRTDLVAAFSADENLFAVRLDKATIVLFDIAAKKERRLVGHQGPCTALAFSPDGKTLISAGEFFHEWDVREGKIRRRVEAGPEYDDPELDFDAKPGAKPNPKPKIRDYVRRMAFAPDGKHFAAQVAWRTVSVWNAQSMGIDWSAATGDDGPLAFSPDGKYLAVLGGVSKIRLLGARTGKLVDPKVDAADVGTLSRFSSDGKAIVTVPWEQSLRARFGPEKRDAVHFDLWNPAGGEPISEIHYPLRGLTSVGFSADGRWAMTKTSRPAARGEDRVKVRIWDTTTKGLVFSLPDHHVGASRTVLADSGSHLATVQDNELCVWALDRPAKKPVWTTTRKERDFLEIWSVDFSPNGKILKVQRRSRAFMASGTGIHHWPTETRFHDGDTGKLLPLFERAAAAEKSFDKHWHWSVFSPDSHLLASTANEVRTGFLLWDLRFDQLLHEVAFDRQVGEFVFAPDSRSLAIADHQGRISLWECATGGMRQQWQAHSGQIGALLYSPDGRYLVSQGPEGSAIVWDLRACRAAPQGKQPVAVSWDRLGEPDSQRAHDATTDMLMKEKESLDFIRQRLRPAPAVSDKQIQTWIIDLDSAGFAARDKAMLSLKAHFEQAHGALKAARRQPKSVETSRRLDQLLEMGSKTYLDVDRLRAGRAVELLEQIGGADAEAILREAAKGDPQARLTQCAVEALRRIERLRH
jgi:WD40 repeat protein